MKEKNKSRKQQLKKAKELKERRKSLHKDLADFIINLQLLLTASPLVALKYQFRNGCKGFYKMRGRNLISRFEEDAKRLRADTTMVFYQKNTIWDDDDDDDRRLSKDQEKLKIREKMILESDSLMNRLIELSFDLDFED